MQTLRLSNEYECYPTWIVGDGLDNVDPAHLPIPVDLARRVDAWDDRYQATYRPDDPAASGFDDGDVQASFAAEGEQLHRELQDALGDGYAVEYRVLR